LIIKFLSLVPCTNLCVDSLVAYYECRSTLPPGELALYTAKPCTRRLRAQSKVDSSGKAVPLRLEQRKKRLKKTCSNPTAEDDTYVPNICNITMIRSEICLLCPWEAHHGVSQSHVRYLTFPLMLLMRCKHSSIGIVIADALEDTGTKSVI
jgi:hypothetical protein